MTNFIERFRHRVVLSASFEITVAPVTFTVPRISEVERENARQKARRRMRDQGLDPATAESAEFQAAFVIEIVDVLKKYVTDWRFAEGVERIPFTQQAAASAIDEMSVEEKIRLAIGYFAAESEDEKKTFKPAPLSTANGSALDSPPSSAPQS